MITALADGLSMLSGYMAAVGVFVVAAWGVGLFALDALLGKRLPAGKKPLAGLCIGGACLALPTFLLALMETVAPGSLRVGGTLLLALAAGRLVLETRTFVEAGRGNTWRAVAPAAATFVLLVLRLGFLKGLLMPPYTDSVIHYQIVRGMLQPELAGQIQLGLQGLTERYYHLGLHSLAAWLCAVTGIGPEAALPLLGQLFLVLAPLSLGFLTLTLTESAAAATWAGVMTGLAWQMPAFAANWGKYPAIGALSVLPAVVASMVLLFRTRLPRDAAARALPLLAAVMLLHTRVILVAGLALLCVWLARKLTPSSAFSVGRAFRFSLLFVVSLAPLYVVLGEFYAGILPTVIMVVLLPFAFLAYPAIAIGSFPFSFSLWVIALLPTMAGGVLPALLNQQFVEMAVFMPLALLGGAGLGGLVARCSHPASRYAIGITATLVALAFVPGARPGLRPDVCCNFVHTGDLQALEWIKESTPANSLVLTSAFSEKGQVFGTDAGIWVQALTGRATNRLTFDTDWRNPAEIMRVCGGGARDIYLYAGGTPYAFDQGVLREQAWARVVFSGGKTILFQVEDCAHLLS
jgi:hypothetical protein